jgi:hypothetical protein
VAGGPANTLFDIDAPGATDTILLVVREALAMGGRDGFNLLRSAS